MSCCLFSGQSAHVRKLTVSRPGVSVSGLGYSICYRLIDEFKEKYDRSHTFTLIFTTRRPPAQTTQTQKSLRKHAARHGEAVDKRIRILAEAVDLMNLRSVRALSRRLNRNIPKLDAIILNAGMGGWTGLDWPLAIWTVLTDLIHQTTWPIYKASEVGVTTGRQTKLPDEEPLGSVFCANVFGHYMLAHNIIPLLRRSGAPNGPGRIIWTSSIEAMTDHLNVEDIQGLRSRAAYESSKTLTDLLALTADLPSSAPFVNSFLSADPDDPSSPPLSLATKEAPNGPGPTTYLCHPGICGTSIVPLVFPLWCGMMAAFYLARWLGSPWHNISTYLAAASAVWLAMSPQSELDRTEAPYREKGGGRSKWGSATGRVGDNYVANTEVDGWGFGGVAGSPILDQDAKLRRKRGMKVATPADRLHFDDLGRRCWQQMEDLRIKWEKLLDEEEEAEKRS